MFLISSIQTKHKMLKTIYIAIQLTFLNSPLINHDTHSILASSIYQIFSQFFVQYKEHFSLFFIVYPIPSPVGTLAINFHNIFNIPTVLLGQYNPVSLVECHTDHHVMWVQWLYILCLHSIEWQGINLKGLMWRMWLG